jgi:hypothetical protein
LSRRVTSAQRPREFRFAERVEAVLHGEQETTAPMEQVGLASSMPEGLVLHPPAALVELGAGVLHDVEGVATWTSPGSIEDRPFWPDRSITGLST